MMVCCSRRWGSLLLVAACALATGGCAAMSNPVGVGIPVSEVPPEFLVPSKEDFKMVPLTALRQRPPERYRLGPGDILGVFIEGVLGDKAQPMPVRFPETGNLAPSVGYPMPVSEDGTLWLPLIAPVTVTDLTIDEAKNAIEKAYVVEKKILQPDRRILITLIRPRQYRVQVVRNDSGGGLVAGGAFGGGVGNLGVSGPSATPTRGTGAAIDLPAYENDLLSALDRTGGLPGSGAKNEVVIQRELKTGGTKIISIPLKLREGETIPFAPADVILQSGDVVVVEPRNVEVYYTGGLMFARQFLLPRDYDLRVSQAVAVAGGPLVNGPFSQNNLSGSVTSSGLGSPSPSRVTVLRYTKHNGRIPIIVNLNRALNDPNEDVIVQANDMLILQETPGEAATRYITSVLKFDFFGTMIRQRDLTATSNLALP